MVKLGKASEVAREVAAESGVESTDTLFSDYTMTPQAAATPRTPAPQTDRILQEAQNVMALTHVDTPLKGGLNTPLHNSDFTGVLPQALTVATPNTVLATPFRSTRSDGANTPGSVGFATPRSGAPAGNFTPSVRDKLNINPEESLDVGETPAAHRSFQNTVKEQLRLGLSSLPAPKNDYEIVVPEHEEEEKVEVVQDERVEDQADVDARLQEELKARAARELALRSQVIQRTLPRPQEVNLAVLRPMNESHSLTELQKAEELIKLEMVTMLQYDNMKNPPPTVTKRSAISQAHQLAFLDQHPYDDFRPDDLKVAKHLLKREMDVVKYGMGHGELPIEAYTQVWEECLGQVLFVPNLNKYTRANLVSKKERLESAEKRLEQNRSHMAREAKKAAKMEKKLKILTGGYQSRAQALIKQLQDYFEQIDQAHLELNTFKFLQDQEKAALPRRIQVSTKRCRGL